MTKIEPMIGRYNWLAMKANKRKMSKFEVHIEKTDDEKESSSSTEQEDYFDLFADAEQSADTEWPDDYWKIKKLTTYIISGNYILTSLALMCLIDCDFSSPVTLQALKDYHQVNLLLNLVECNHLRVQVGALRCLEKLANIKSIRYEMVYFGGLESIVNLLWKPCFALQRGAATTISKIAVFQRAWKIARKLDAIHLLTHLLYAPKRYLKKDPKAITDDERLSFEVAAAGADALGALCVNERNKKLFWKSGGLIMCSQIIATNHTALLISVMDLLQYCAKSQYFRVEIRKLGILVGIQRHLFGNDRRLTQLSAQVVFQCAYDVLSRDFFGQKGFVEKMYELVSAEENYQEEDLMASATGALWKCCKSYDNVVRLHDLGGIPLILQLLRSPMEAIQVHIAGCLSLCFRYPPSAEVIFGLGGLETMSHMLNTTHGPLIINLTTAMAEASVYPEYMDAIEELQGIERVWSHLKNNDLQVVSISAWSLCKLLENVKDSPAVMRSVVGGLEVIMNLLWSPYTRLSSPACKIVVVLSRDIENLLLLTEYGVVRVLSMLITTKCKILRYYLCKAIHGCCPIKNNLREFGKITIVKYLMRMLKSKTHEVQYASCLPLSRLSVIPKCCKVISECQQVQKILMHVMDHDDKEAAESAALVIQNIRFFMVLRGNTFTDYLLHQIEERHRKLVGGATL